MEKYPYLRAVAAVLFAAVCAWLGAGIFPRLRPATEKTAAAAPKTSIILEGIALREEEALFLPEGAELLGRDGERLAAGTAVAVFGSDCFVSGKSAVFLHDCDGFETLSPEDAAPLSVDRVRSLLDMSAGEKGSARLVSGFEWYYAALSDYREALPEGEYRLRFPGFEAPVEARLMEVSPTEEDGQALLFRIRIGDAGLLALRRCRAELILP